jgi:predicted nucleic acid-binding protein
MIVVDASMSLETGASVYDSLYVALAEQRETTLVTDDRRLITSFAKSEWSKWILPLTDIESIGM